jgi:hypothetical protein
MDAEQGGRVGRRCHHNGPLSSRRIQRSLDEIRNFSPAFTNESHHDDVGLREARHHAKKHGFPDPGAGKQAKALAPANGQHGVDSPNAHVQWFLHRRPAQGIQGASQEGNGLRAVGRWRPVQGAP